MEISVIENNPANVVVLKTSPNNFLVVDSLIFFIRHIYVESAS
jgi:hypothetical protein